jgi:hypothetical protein
MNLQQAPARLLFALVVGLLGFFIWTAWIVEDAFITLRTVDNFIHGYGLRWNIAERVQTYTHPLSMFALTAGALVMGDIYYSTIIPTIAAGIIAPCLSRRTAARHISFGIALYVVYVIAIGGDYDGVVIALWKAVGFSGFYRYHSRKPTVLIVG